MNFFPKKMLFSMIPPTGSLKMSWEKLPRSDDSQEIEIRISPDHLQACRDSGVCVEGCPARELLLVARLLVR